MSGTRAFEFLHESCYVLCRTLRPYPISSKRLVPAHIDLPDWAADVSCSSNDQNLSRYGASSIGDLNGNEVLHFVAISTCHYIVDLIKEIYCRELQKLSPIVISSILSR